MLKRLLKQDIYVQYKYDDKSIDNLLYIANKPADYFIIILQGRCSVEIGNDNMKFEAGPFSTFAGEALLYGGMYYKSYTSIRQRIPAAVLLAAVIITCV